MKLFLLPSCVERRWAGPGEARRYAGVPEAEMEEALETAKGTLITRVRQEGCGCPMIRGTRGSIWAACSIGGKSGA